MTNEWIRTIMRIRACDSLIGTLTIQIVGFHELVDVTHTQLGLSPIHSLTAGQSLVGDVSQDAPGVQLLPEPDIKVLRLFESNGH